MWVYGLCAHTMALKQLKRLGTLTGVPKGSQTKVRALLAGLVTLANQTTDQVKVIVQLASVWEAWNHPKHRSPYMDLLAEVPPHDYQRVTVLYISKNTRTPDAPANEPQLKRRQREAALAAWERAKTFYDAKQEEWQETLDQDHQLIYEHAVNRLSKIYADNMHYVHQKAPRHQGKHTKQYKKELVNRCRKPWADNHHHWEPHQRSDFQCRSCGIRMHQSLTTEVLETRLNEDCPQMLIETGPTSAAEAAPLPRKQTRAQRIKELLESQPAQPISGQHHLAETTGYLKFVVCGLNIHKRLHRLHSKPLRQPGLHRRPSRPPEPCTMADRRTSQMHSMRRHMEPRWPATCHSDAGIPQTLQRCRHQGITAPERVLQKEGLFQQRQP